MKQDAFAVAPDIVSQTHPVLAPRSLAGGAKDFTMAVPRASSLLGKMNQVSGIDVFRTSRRAVECATNTKGSQINGTPYAVADTHDLPPVEPKTTDAGLHRGDGNDDSHSALESCSNLLLPSYGNAGAETKCDSNEVGGSAQYDHRPQTAALHIEKVLILCEPERKRLQAVKHVLEHATAPILSPGRKEI